MRKGCIVLFLSFLSILMSQTRTSAVQEINLVATDGFHKTSELTTIQNMNLKHLEIATAPVPHAKLSIDKEVYKPGEKIVLEFIISKGTDPSVWVDILPADVPHGNVAFNQILRIDYQHFSGRRNGRLTFEAPMTPGAYDFRLNEKDSEIASIPFEVRLLERIASSEQKRIGVSAERGIRIYEKTFHTNRYNANFPYNVHIHDLDGDRISELLMVGVLTDYSFIPTSNRRCEWCNQWQIDSYRWDGQSLLPQKSGRLDVGFDTLVRSAVGRTGGATKIVGVGHMYPCGSARAHAGMAVFNHELQNEHYDWGGRKKKDPCMSDYAMFSTVAMADVDGDGTQEIVAGGSGDPSGGQDPYKDWLLTIRTSDGRSFTEKIYKFIDHGATQERLTDLVVADLDGDGAMEIAAVGYRKINGVYRSILQLFVWDGKTLQTKFTTGFETGKEDFLHHLAVGDLDGDGRPEMILAGWVKKDDRRMWHVQVARWNGTIVEKIAEKSWPFEHDASIESVTVADVDADGSKEVVLAGNIHTEGVPDAKKYGYVHHYADWHLKVVSATSPNWEEKYAGDWKSSRQYDTNGNRKPDANDQGALGRLFDMKVGDLDGDGRMEVVLAGEWVWTGWHIKVLPLAFREPFKWTSTYDFAEAKVKVLKDPVVGEVFRQFSGQMTGGKGVVHEKKKITGHTLTLKDAKQAAELVVTAKKKAVTSGHYIGTIKVNGIRFVMYEGASLGFIGDFGNTVFHMTCDMADAVISAVKSAVSSIGSALPDYDLDPNVTFGYPDDVKQKLAKVRKVVDEAASGLSNLTREAVNTLLELGSDFAGRLKTLTDNLNPVYDAIIHRAGGFARSKTNALKGKASNARDRAGEMAELMMTAAEFAQVLGKQNITNVRRLIELAKPELVQSALVKEAVEMLKDKMGDEVGLHITVDGVVIDLGGTYSMPNRLEDLIGEAPAHALFYSTGIRRVDVVVTSKTDEGHFVRFESWSGVTGELMAKKEEDGSKKMYVQAGFEGGKVSLRFLPILGVTTGQRITPHDWIKMTAGLDYGSTGLPTLRPMMPGVEVKVELSKDIGANRVLKLTWDPNPKFAYQGQAALAMDCTAYVQIGGGTELSAALNLSLDATQLGMAEQKIAQANLTAVKDDLLKNVEKEVTSLVDLASVIDMVKTAQAPQTDPNLRLQYMNAAAPFIPMEQFVSFGNQFSMHKLALYEANILKEVAPSEIKDLVTKGSSLGISFGVGIEAGVGEAGAGAGGKLAADLGVEFGLNLQGQFLSHLADATDDAKKALVEALYRKGYELLSGPTTAVKNYLKENNLMAGEQEETGMSTDSLSEMLSLSMLSQIDWRDEITKCIDTYYIQPIKNNPQAMADLAQTDLFFSLGLTPVKGKLALAFGAELAPSIGVTLHANGETLLNWKGYNTTELQQYSLTVGSTIPVSAIVNEVGKITGAVGWDVFVVELTQKFDSTESVLNPFHSGLPKAGIKVDPASWVQNIPVGADVKKTVKVTNTGKRRFDVTVVVPDNLTASVTRANLGENESFDLNLGADTSQERVLDDSVQLLTGIPDTFAEIPVNLNVSSTGAVSGLVLSETIWKAKMLRSSKTSKTFTVANGGSKNVTAEITAPAWVTIAPTSLSLKAGESKSFTVHVDTSQDAVRSGQITVKGATNPLLLDLVVTSPKIRMEPAGIRATTSKDQTMKKTLTLYNDGGFDLTVNLKPDTVPAWIKPGKTSLTIASMKHETMNLTLSVKKDCDQYASLVLKSNDPDHSEVTLPITVSAKGDVEIRWGGEVDERSISLGEDLLGKPDFRGSQMLISSTINSPRRFIIKQFGGEHKRKQTVGFYDSGKLSTLLGVERETIAKADIVVFFNSKYMKKTRHRIEKVETKCTMTKWVFHDGKNTEEMVQNKWEPAGEVIASGMFTDYDYAVALNIYPDFSQVSAEHKNKLKTRKRTFLLIDVPGVIDLHAPEFSIDLSSLSIFRRSRSYVMEDYKVYIDAIGILRFSKD